MVFCELTSSISESGIVRREKSRCVLLVLVGVIMRLCTIKVPVAIRSNEHCNHATRVNNPHIRLERHLNHKHGISDAYASPKY